MRWLRLRLMEKVELPGDGHCVWRLLLETALLPPPIGRRRWKRACCDRKTRSFPLLEEGQHGELCYLGRRLAHVVSKRLLVACELTSELGIPSEPCTELIPSAFRVEKWAILVIWAIFHFWGERTSMAAVVAEKSTGNFGQHIAERQQIPPCAGHGNS